MNGLLTLVIIVAVYLPVMVIFAALRAIIEEAYEQGKKDAHMWTPTTEGRPPIDKPVLVCDFTGYRDAAILKKRDGVYRWQTVAGLRLYEDITAWQEMPEAYTGENDETEHEAEENEK